MTELIHGIDRTDSAERRTHRERFVEELCSAFVIYPFTAETAAIAGRIDGQQAAKGIVIPFPDLLIGATALALGFSILTFNTRHFALIPGLNVISA